jgi:hypothetical protein
MVKSKLQTARKNAPILNTILVIKQINKLFTELF